MPTSILGIWNQWCSSLSALSMSCLLSCTSKHSYIKHPLLFNPALPFLRNYYVSYNFPCVVMFWLHRLSLVAMQSWQALLDLIVQWCSLLAAYSCPVQSFCMSKHSCTKSSLLLNPLFRFLSMFFNSFLTIAFVLFCVDCTKCQCGYPNPALSLLELGCNGVACFAAYL